MSIELAVGISHVTNKELVIHYMNNNGDQLYDYKKIPIYTPSRWHNNQRKAIMNENHFPHLKDILDWPNKENNILIDEKINYFPQEDKVIENFAHDYYYSNCDLTEDEEIFADKRKRLYFEDQFNYHLKQTLGWYSRFFYQRDKSLDLKLNQVKFKKEYLDFADKIAKTIGEFSGAHLRLTDHLRMFNTTQEMFEAGLDELEKYGLPILLSTDDPNHEMVLKNKHRVVMLDEIIIDYFKNDFLSLPYQDEVIFGMICNLVMHQSLNFIGTSGSTYTAYIQRNRNQNELEENWLFFDKLNKQELNKYGWVNYDLNHSQKMWWREWPYSKLIL
jgi:hypothetical protein